MWIVWVLSCIIFTVISLGFFLMFNENYIKYGDKLIKLLK